MLLLLGKFGTIPLGIIILCCFFLLHLLCTSPAAGFSKGPLKFIISCDMVLCPPPILAALTELGMMRVI